MPYGARYGQEDLFDLMHTQVELMFRYLRDERTGLLYHACDFSRQMPWADSETGCSPEFWGRAIGWVGLSLVDMLDFLPAEDPRPGNMDHGPHRTFKGCGRIPASGKRPLVSGG